MNLHILKNISSSQKSFFEIAKKISELSTFHRKNIKVGCIVVHGKRIISSGYNSDKSHPIQKRYNIYRFSDDTPHTLHAEISALIPIMHDSTLDFSKLKIFIYRQKANGSLGSSKPCQSCRNFMKDLGIKHVYYTTDEGFCHEEI